MANEELINVLKEKREGHNETISYMNKTKPDNQKIIDYFTSPTRQIDNQIIPIVSNINTLKTEIVSLAAGAYAVGCGTTGGATTVYPDVVRNYVANLSSATYDGNSPYGSTASSLSSSNVGIGTLLVYTQNDSSQSGIGSLYASVNTCFRPKSLIPLVACVSGECVSFAASITTRQNQITQLVSQVVSLVSNTNGLRRERLEYELQRYSFNQSILYFNNRNTQIEGTINFLNQQS